MKQSERDELLVEQRDMLASIADRLDRKERDRDRRSREPVMPPLPRKIRHRPTWSTFEKLVPDTFLEAGVYPTVRCPCGGVTELNLAVPMMCAGECGRAFVRVFDGSVRCHQFHNDEERAA